MKEAKEIYISKSGLDIKEYPLNNARLFYKGKEMKENHQLGEYNLENECVIQLFIRKNEV